MESIAYQEVKEAIEEMIKILSPLAERNPEASITGEDFNKLLLRARAALPQSPAIRDLEKINQTTTLMDLLVKLSILSGAIKATFDDGSSAVRSEERDRFHRGLEEFMR